MERLLWMVVMLLSLVVPIARAQESVVGALKASPWLVIVGGEARTRTLRVLGVKAEEKGVYTLDAVYGWSDGNQTPVEARFAVESDGKKLFITTQPGTKIATVQNAEGVFSGTFTPTNGQTKGVEIKSMSEAEIQSVLHPQVKPAGPEVPSVCAAFLGGWTGDWGFGKRQLWVTEVTSSCVVRYAYSPKLRDFKELVVKEGVLSFPCGSSGGTCHFTSHGNELWGRYGGPDGNNNTVYRRM